MTATNVTPQELNYANHSRDQYDDEIRRSIPGHRELHDRLAQIVHDEFHGSAIRILELGSGTGLTAERVLLLVPGSDYAGIDFSEVMAAHTRNRLSRLSVPPLTSRVICADYAQIPFWPVSERSDLVLSVIGIHHQGTDEAKKNVFRKVYNCLRGGGLFLFGDLMTFRDQRTAALNEALHYHHLVANARDEQSLREWAYHHKFQNALAPMESQMNWLREVGFRQVDVAYQKFNTVLVVAKK
ncbi:class I SAM-dependent methyltransferase [Candidatus Woesearchaeota archaeon]|nr:class I SAM-dependent methyltransferase [Candidatus Woesearchaeota archaeon]